MPGEIKEKFRHIDICIDKTRPYHVTICTLHINGKDLAEGLSICSYSDQYNRKRGNTIARGRAVKALAEKRSYNPIREKLRKALLLDYAYKGVYYQVI